MLKLSFYCLQRNHLALVTSAAKLHAAVYDIYFSSDEIAAMACAVIVPVFVPTAPAKIDFNRSRSINSFGWSDDSVLIVSKLSHCHFCCPSVLNACLLRLI